METKRSKKTFEVSRDGRIVVYPSLYEHKTRGGILRLIRKILRTEKAVH